MAYLVSPVKPLMRKTRFQSGAFSKKRQSITRQDLELESKYIGDAE
jgi:hypothetical protein